MEESKGKLNSHLIVRFLIIFFILGIVYYSENLYPSPIFKDTFTSIITLLTIAFIFTFVSFFILKTIKKTEAFTYYQIFFEIVFISAIIEFTGVTGSFFYFLYYLSIISSSILLGKRGAFYTASIASILYGIVIVLDLYNIYPGINMPDEVPFVRMVTPTGLSYKLLISVISFYLTAFLTSYLISLEKKTREDLEKKVIDYKKLEELYSDIVSSISSGIFTVNFNNKITSFNKGAEEITGYGLADVYMKEMRDFFPGIPLEEHDFKSLKRFETPFAKKDGGLLYLGFSVSNLKKDDKEEGKIFIFQDLTEIKIMEEKLKKSETLALIGQMAAGIAHEIRNPLTSISGSIEFLKDELNLSLSVSQKELFSIVGKETSRLNQLINDFLQFAKPKEPELSEINVNQIIEDVILLFEKKSYNIKKELLAKSNVIGDRNQISQVLINLLKNSEESFLSGNDKFISITTKENGQFLSIVVEDNGCGVREDNLRYIFTPFFTTKASGTGLGLATVKRIIDSHNGNISIASKEGIGTRIIISLPAAG